MYKNGEVIYSMCSIGEKLKTLRKGRKLTQQELSEKLGLSRATISNYEVGRRSPHLTDLRRLAEFYGVGLDYFGVNTTDESFELLSRAKSVFLNDNIPKEEKERLYKSIMKIYLQMD
jgi:transcriptional regulator with XRE-family HTH domain